MRTKNSNAFIGTTIVDISTSQHRNKTLIMLKWLIFQLNSQHRNKTLIILKWLMHHTYMCHIHFIVHVTLFQLYGPDNDYLTETPTPFIVRTYELFSVLRCIGFFLRCIGFILRCLVSFYLLAAVISQCF